MLLWTYDLAIHPTFRNRTDSFEAWAYRNGFLRQIQRLEKQKWLERQAGDGGDRLHRLTELGRREVLGAYDPTPRWNRHWDGRWRMVLFDVPEERSVARNRLRYYLHGRGFGYLQHSVWITPDPAKEERALLADGPVDPGALLLLEARPCAGETDAEIVAAAWDYADINRRYATHEAVLAKRPRRVLDTQEAATAFHLWLRKEREAWHQAVSCDPFLPRVLLPPNYAGREAWRRRQDVLRDAGKQMRGFRLA